ncbi:hypothetical protein CCMA1212_003578 [Trichoderma ghanense]|uniref:Uncharacterized protein n=1 Tax=Trichoderma ghanense TaxID=65468 RepID=A0ABY2H7D6_9HYPO
MSTTNDAEPRSPNSVQVACGFGPGGQGVIQTPWRYNTSHVSPRRFGYRTARLVPVVVACVCKHTRVLTLVYTVRASRRAIGCHAKCRSLHVSAGYSSAQPASVPSSSHATVWHAKWRVGQEINLHIITRRSPIYFDSSCQCVWVDPGARAYVCTLIHILIPGAYLPPRLARTLAVWLVDRGPGFPLLQHVCWPQILQGKPLARSLEQVQPGLVAPPKGRAHAYPDDDDDHSAWQPALSPSFRILFATKILCCAYYFACPVARGRPSQRSLPLTGGLCCRTSRLVRTAESVREKPSQGSLAATCIQYKVPFRSRWTPALH